MNAQTTTATTQTQTTPRLVRVCSWCPDHVEQTASARANGHDVTHTICPACLSRELEQS